MAGRGGDPRWAAGGGGKRGSGGQRGGAAASRGEGRRRSLRDAERGGLPPVQPGTGEGRAEEGLREGEARRDAGPGGRLRNGGRRGRPRQVGRGGRRQVRAGPRRAAPRWAGGSAPRPLPRSPAPPGRGCAAGPRRAGSERLRCSILSLVEGTEGPQPSGLPKCRVPRALPGLSPWPCGLTPCLASRFVSSRVETKG